MKILSLCLLGTLLVVATTFTATGSANNNHINRITNRLLQIAEAQLADNNNADVSIVSQRAYSDAYTFHIIEVQNTGTESAEFVQIVASFYNGNGQFVGTSFTYTTPTTVSPGTKAPFDIQLLTDDRIAKESKSYQLTLTWMNQNGKEMIKQYRNADLRQEQGQQSSSSSIVGSSNTLSQTTEATTTATTTDTSFAAKALQFLTYCNNQFSQTPVSSMTTDTLVFCTMVYDWYLMGCNNTVLAPIIAAQCKDPVIMQLIINYKTQIDIRIKQIVKIVVRPPRDGGGNGNDTGNNQTGGGGSDNQTSDGSGSIVNQITGGGGGAGGTTSDNETVTFSPYMPNTCMGGTPGTDGCRPYEGANTPGPGPDIGA